MKADIKSLYENLTPAELARVAFHYCSLTDEGKELRKIAESVPIRTYHGLDKAYQDGLATLMAAALWWAFSHWRMRHHCAGAMGMLVAVRLRDDSPDVIQQVIDRLWDIEGQLLALDAALDDVCNAQGLSADDVRRIADAEPYQPIIESDKLISDPEAREFFREQLVRLLPAGAGH